MSNVEKVFVAGHRGLVGSAIVRKLNKCGYTNIVTCSHSELDLTRQSEVDTFFEKERPEYVYLAAAKVGGIGANNIYPADFMYINLAIQTNVIHASYKCGVKKLMFLGSGCIYPRDPQQPIKEDYLLTGVLEKTNEAYAIAKIAGLKMCEFYNRQYGTNYISCMPANLYGRGDNFSLENSHVVPALIRKFADAVANRLPSVTMWGTGIAMREFLHVDDMADATVFLMEHYDIVNGAKNVPCEPETVNIGCGADITIKHLAEMIAEITGFNGEFKWDSSKPDGTPRKLLDSSKLFGMGWKPTISLYDGLKGVYEDYLENKDKYRN